MEHKRQLSLRIEQMLEGDGLEMVFQPIVAFEQQAVVGVEALARFAAIPYRAPDAWFADAATVGLGNALQVAAMARAIDCVAELPAGTYLALNASLAAIGSPFLLRQTERLEPSRLVVELTDPLAADEGFEPPAGLQRLRELGVRLAVDAPTGRDDAVLRQVQPDIVKLDRAGFAGNDAPLAEDRIGALVALCDELGAQLQAEGIETAAELAHVRSAGIGHGQGYLLGEPGPLPVAATFPA